MGLTIRSDRVQALAREVADRTGKTQTAAIEWALERARGDLDRESSDAPRRKLINKLQRSASNIDLDADSLYDRDGLPR